MKHIVWIDYAKSIPYLWIGAAGYPAWLLVLRHYGSDAGSGHFRFLIDK